MEPSPRQGAAAAEADYVQQLQGRNHSLDGIELPKGGAVVPQADIGIYGPARQEHIPRIDLSIHTSGQDRGAGSELQAQDEAQPPWKAGAHDQGKEHTQQDKHPRQTGGCRRHSIWRLGNGHHHWQERKGSHSHAHRTIDKHAANGEAPEGQKPETPCRGRGAAAVPLPRQGSKDDHHRQRKRILRPRDYHRKD